MDLYMLFSYERDPRYGVVLLELVTANSQGKLKHLSYAPHYEDLAIRAQHSTDHSNFYGFKAHYRSPRDVDLARAKIMARELRRIEKGLKRYERVLGPASSFAVYAKRVAQILNVRGLFVWDGRGFALRAISELGDLIAAKARRLA